MTPGQCRSQFNFIMLLSSSLMPSFKPTANKRNMPSTRHSISSLLYECPTVVRTWGSSISANCRSTSGSTRGRYNWFWVGERALLRYKGHYTHEPRAVTTKLWDPKRKCPKAVPKHLQTHVMWSWILKCSVRPYVTGPSIKCYFNEIWFMWIVTHDKIE